MRRLYKHQRRQIYRYIILLVLVIVLISTLGLKLLVNISLFIASISGRDRQDRVTIQKSEEYILPPELFDIPEATNTATLNVTGRATMGMALEFYVNDILQKKTNLDSDNFEEEIVLVKGENSLYLEIVDPKSKKRKESKTFRVLYLKDKPKLEVTAPSDGEKFTREEISVVGITDKGNSVKVNSLPTVVDSSGMFNYSVRLKEGENKITIEAFDIAGSSVTKELTVYYQKE